MPSHAVAHQTAASRHGAADHEHDDESTQVPVNLNASAIELARFIRTHPQLARTVIEAIQRKRGNHFAQQVIAAHRTVTTQLVAQQQRERHARHGAAGAPQRHAATATENESEAEHPAPEAAATRRSSSTEAQPHAPTHAAPQSGFALSARSRSNLSGVHPQMVQLVELALRLSEIDFVVTEGLRTAERQQALLARGKSWVKRSRHQDGLAVDVMALPRDGSDNWAPAHYHVIYQAFAKAAQQLGANLTWGGHWNVRDYVHFEIEVDE